MLRKKHSVQLYMLLLTDPGLSYREHSEDFPIGIFKTKEEAEDTALYYMKNVKGFRDFPCKYKIIKKSVACPDDITPDIVWIVEGWNRNEDFDEIDVVESRCFLTEEEANSELQRMKKKYKRSEWYVNDWQIGKKYWGEGFIREINGVDIN